MTDQEHVADALSNREQEVATAYATGQSYKEIARDLGLSPTTVRSHLRTVYSKLGVTSKLELARFLKDASMPEEDRDTATLVADLALELDEAIRRERGLAKILKIISKQEGQLEPVIDAVLDHALEICEAEFGILMEFHGDMRFSELQSRNISPAFATWMKEQGIFEVAADTAIGQLATTLQIVNIADVRGEDLYQNKNPLRIATADLGKARSFAVIPMMSGNRLIGAFTVYRTRVHPFNERALELAQVFSDQAVIAIENVRQVRELQQRLDRQVATREILEAISRSRNDEGPVFDAIIKNVRRLWNAPSAALILGRAGDEHQVMVAHHGVIQNTIDVYRKGGYPMDPKVSFGARAILEKRVIHLHDMRDTAEYRAGLSSISALADNQGIRTNLLVPLISGGEGIGCLILTRDEVRPYSDDQIALVETFAAQAVIAIENVHQFRELQARLAREQGTAEILQLISQSREDEAPVFDLILKKAAELCGADAAALTLGSKGDTHQRMVASRDVDPASIAHYNAGHVSMNPETSLAAKAILTGAPTHIEDFAETDGYKQGDGPMRSLVDDTGMRTSMFVPLLSKTGGIGALILFRKDVRTYSADEVALVQTFAAQAVIAIENVQQFRALESLNAELGKRVEGQVDEIERMSRLKRFLSPAVADALVNSGDESILASHRALIATLFCDIRGFTAFCETAEPEETIEVLQIYHEEMGKLISAHKGGVDKRMGDGIMVIFNDPLPCEDPAGDAVRLAVAMREKMVELCKKWKRLGHRLGFGVGVSFGYATIGMVGSEGRYDYTASGTSVNLAARLCDRAEDGEILLSPRAYTAIEDDFQAESSGEVSLKGIREPVEVFKLKDTANRGAAALDHNVS